MEIGVGPHTFAASDARRALSHAFDLLDVYPEVVRAAQGGRRQRLEDREFGRIHHSNGPISRVYATVLDPGAVSLADDAVIEPT